LGGTDSFSINKKAKSYKKIQTFCFKKVNAYINGLLSMPPNSQPENPTLGGTAASQTLAIIRKKETNSNQWKKLK
jgi:hypothetical protein